MLSHCNHSGKYVAIAPMMDWICLLKSLNFLPEMHIRSRA